MWGEGKVDLVDVGQNCFFLDLLKSGMVATGVR